MAKRKHETDSNIQKKLKKSKLESIENKNNIEVISDNDPLHLSKNIEDLDGDFSLDSKQRVKKSNEKKLKSNKQDKNIKVKKLKEIATSESSIINDKLNSRKKQHKTDFNEILPKFSNSIEDLYDDNYLKESSTKPSKSQSRRKRKRITDILSEKGPTPPEAQEFIQEVKSYFQDKLTRVELETISISESNIALCNDLTYTPISFLKSLFPKWKKNILNCIDLPRRPLLLVICPSGIRCVNFIRAISEFKIEKCKIAKLFAKHMKVEEQQKFMSKNTIHIAVGTPRRLQQLLQTGDLSLDHVKHVVLDWSFRDGKQLRMIDQDQLKKDLMAVLQKNILPFVSMGQFKIALF